MSVPSGLALRKLTGYIRRNVTEIVMRIDGLEFSSPIFSQPDAVRLSRANAATLDNWLRYEHVRTFRVDGAARSFAFSDLLTIDCIENLTAVFKMPPKVAANFARKAVEQYEVGFNSDVCAIARGEPWPAADRQLDAHFSFAREGDEVIELGREDNRPDSVMMVFPTRLVARRLLATIRDDEAFQGRADA